MYAVKGIEVSTSIIDIVRHSLSLHLSLYDRVLETVVEQIIEPSNWYLTLCSLDGDIVKITRGTVIKLGTPLINYRVCLGDVATSISRNTQEDMVYIYKTSTICTRRATVDNFCMLHKGSSYSRYLTYVYGLREPPPDTGLALVPHMVYILYIGGQELKVGIANIVKNMNRLYEQIFIYSSIVTFTDSVASARNIEKTLSRTGVRDRAVITERVDWLKKVELVDIGRYLRSFATLFLRYVKPTLLSLGIDDNKMFIPVVRFSDKCFEKVKNSTVLYDRGTLNSLEGKAVVEDYCIGGILLKVNHRNYYIPYQLIRDRILNIDIIK